MRTLHVLVVAVVAAAALLSACDARQVEEGQASGCTGCHGGTDNGSGAPPRDTKGANDSPAVGAHSAHVAEGVKCASCHVVPSDANSPGHIDKDRADVTFAGAPGALGTYDASTRTCTSTWCHARGGFHPVPRWTEGAAALSPSRCDACHPTVTPAPPHHPPEAIRQCSHCHPKTLSPENDLLPGGGAHANGVFDYESDLAVFCTGCHGDASRATSVAIVKAAPPVDADGNADTPVVGAHLAHLLGKNISDGVECSDCHGAGTTRTLPSVPDWAHAAGGILTVTPKRPGADGAVGTFVEGTRTCSSTYCHDPLGQGTNAPTWGETGTQSNCARCHAPQAWTSQAGPFTGHHGDHVCRACHGDSIPNGLKECSVCHAGYERPLTDGGAFTLDKAAHVNGTKNLNTAWGPGATDTIGFNPADRSCSTSCHDLHGVQNPQSW